MSIQAVLLPLFVQVALTFVLLFWTGYLRSNLLKTAAVKPQDVALREPNWPPRVAQICNAYQNQLEVPVLFYVLTILAWVTRHADLLFVVMAWIFVALRLVHAYIMGDQRPRAAVLGMLRLERKLDCDAIAARADGGRFAPSPLSAEERARLGTADLTGAPPWVAGDYPQWLDPHLARVFGDERVAEGTALASRAPLDLRVNGLKAEPEAAADALAHLNPIPTRWSPVGLRIALDADAKSPAIHAEPAFIKGTVEVQDEGSQLSALLAGAKPGQQVVDLCAGAGGKTLALAAAMENRGQLYATDSG